MIAARLLALAIHALLNDDPASVVGHDEAVQIKIEAVLHGGTVDLGDETARGRKRAAVKADAIADRQQAPAASGANACRVRRKREVRVRG